MFAFQRPGGTGYLRRADGTFALPGRDPALGAGLVGWRDAQSRIVLATTDTLTPVAGYDAPGAGPFAFSDRWVVWLVGGRQLFAQPRDSSAAPREVARARGTEQLGRPSIVGATVVYHRAGTSGSQIRLLDLATGRDTLLRSEHRALLSNPTFDGRRVLYVRSVYTRQELRLGPLQPRATTKDQRLYTTWPTARRDLGLREGPPPPPRRLQGPQAAEALAPPARRHHRHAVDDGARPDDRLRDPDPQAGRGRHHVDDPQRSALTNVNCGWVRERGASRRGNDDFVPLGPRSVVRGTKPAPTSPERSAEGVAGRLKGTKPRLNPLLPSRRSPAP